MDLVLFRLHIYNSSMLCGMVFHTISLVVVWTTRLVGVWSEVPEWISGRLCFNQNVVFLLAQDHPEQTSRHWTSLEPGYMKTAAAAEELASVSSERSSDNPSFDTWYLFPFDRTIRKHVIFTNLAYSSWICTWKKSSSGSIFSIDKLWITFLYWANGSCRPVAVHQLHSLSVKNGGYIHVFIVSQLPSIMFLSARSK